MKVAIVYCSQTGFTERYAKWLSEELACEAVSYSKRSAVDLNAIDTLVFCSWFHAASIKGSKWLKKTMGAHPNLRVIVLATGATPMPETGWPTQDEIDVAFSRTFPKSEYPSLPCFYCQGGYDFDRLGAPDKIAMRMFYKMHEKNDDPKAHKMLETMRKGFDGTRREHLKPMLDYIEGLKKEGSC